MQNSLNFFINDAFLKQGDFNRGIKHDFPFINIRPWEVLKTEGETVFNLPEGPCECSPSVFNTSLWTLRMLMNDKIKFDRYYCINSAKHCQNEENIGALYFKTSLHFPTRVRF